MSKEKTNEYAKTFKKNKWFFSLGAIGHDMVYYLVVSYLLTFVQFGYRLSVQQYFTITLFIGVIGRLWDAITDPIMGLIIQKCNFKLGKYRPWILLGAVLTGMFTVFLFNTPFQGWKFVWYIIIVNVLWETCYTINDISYWSMLPSLTSDSKERNLISTMTLFFAGMGGGIVQGIVTVFQTGNVLETYSSISVICAISIIFFQGMTSLFVKEKPINVIQDNNLTFKQMIHNIFKNKQLLIVALALGFYVAGNGLFASLLYNIYYLEVGYDADIFVVLVVFAFFSTICQFIFPWISKYLSRKKILTIATILSSFGYLFFLLIGWFDFLPFNLLTMSLSGLFIYFGNGLIYLVTMIQITNCVEYNEYKTGNREEAVVSTVRPFVVKTATAIKYGLTSLVLIISGVFSLSQNISNLEVQKNYFSKISSDGTNSKFEMQKYYLKSIHDYYWEIISSSEENYSEKLEEIDTLIDNDEILSSFKLDAETIVQCSSLYVSENSYVIGQIKDINVDSLTEGKTYNLVITGSYYNEDGVKIKFNVGNEGFKDKSNISNRVSLRILSSVIPMVCLIINWHIQYKYYIIDENYYDLILKELEERKKNQGDKNE